MNQHRWSESNNLGSGEFDLATSAVADYLYIESIGIKHVTHTVILLFVDHRNTETISKKLHVYSLHVWFGDHLYLEWTASSC